MPSKKQQLQEWYEQISPFIDEAAEQYYSGDRDRGFLHWAFATIFTVGHDLEDTDIIDYTAIDGPDDFEIDGRYIPELEDDSVVNLLQCKHRKPGTTMSAADIAPFLNSPNRVLNAEEVVHSHNEEIKDLHDRLKKMLKESKVACTINLVWATSGTLSPQARRHVEQNSSDAITIVVDGNPTEVKVTLDCWDLERLYQHYMSQRDSDDFTTQCDVEFELQPDTYHQAQAKNTYRTLSTTAPVKHIIEAFRKYGYKLFRENPRGPLGNKINSSIKRTLLDQTDRQRFHLLNNGITAICLSWKLEPNDKLVVQDFQIINGCQTTVTLWAARASVEDDPNVLVTVKLTECPMHFGRAIARTTNTQASLKAEDSISNEAIQIKLKKEFDDMSPPWFYQIKRGDWNKMMGGQYEKEKYRDPEGGFRKLTSKEVSQAAMAFAGFPGEAKDRIRLFLNKEEISTIAREGSISYDRIYVDSLSARQLLLPALIQRRVWQRVAADKETEDWLEYARFYIICLIGETLKLHYDSDQNYLFSTDRSQKLAAAIDEWFSPIYNVARAAIRNARQASSTQGMYRGHREFFRAPANYRAIESNLTGALQMASDFGDPTAGLPN